MSAVALGSLQDGVFSSMYFQWSHNITAEIIRSHGSMGVQEEEAKVRTLGGPVSYAEEKALKGVTVEHIPYTINHMDIQFCSRQLYH